VERIDAAGGGMNAPVETPWCVTAIHDKPGLDSRVVSYRIDARDASLVIASIANGTPKDRRHAHMMAAAQELHAAAELALPILEQYARIGYGNAADALSAVRAAIAKAQETAP
jgi:hypothetical protein